MNERKQRESGRRLVLAGGFAALVGGTAAAQTALDPGGMTFRDFAVEDNGASFGRGDPMIAGGPNQVSSKVLGVEPGKGLARVRFGSIRVDVAIPLGWQATEDPERGVAYSADKRYRLLIWRVDFAFEGVKDAEHYAATKSGSIQSRRPTVQAQARRLADGLFLVVYDNVPRGQGDSETRTVFDLVIQNPRNAKEGVLVTLGAPGSDSVRTLRLLALIQQNMKISW